jgi:chromate reductase
MGMITVVCATNRPGNHTRKVVQKYLTLISEKEKSCSLLSMEDLPADFAFNDAYGKRSKAFQDLLDKHVAPASRLVVISPEYNGSFPGVFKMFLDAIKPEIWEGKKVALVGVSAGRAGNVRGMDHLIQIFHHLKMVVLPNQIPISSLGTIMDDAGFEHSETVDLMKEQLEQLIKL